MDKRFLYTGSFWTHYKEIKINSQVKMKLSICIFFTSYCNCNKIHLAFQYQKTISFDIYMGADKSLARPGRKQANVSVRMAWISFDALPCRGGGEKLDDSSRLDVVEIARVPDMLPSLFLLGRAKDLSAPR